MNVMLQAFGIIAPNSLRLVDQCAGSVVHITFLTVLAMFRAAYYTGRVSRQYTGLQ